MSPISQFAHYVDQGLIGLFALTVATVLRKFIELWCPALIFQPSLAVASKGTPAGLAAAVRRRERGMTLLGQIVSVAPFIGLAATVMHIIEALQSLQAPGADATALYGLLATAMYSTLWGLASAIPASFFHGMFHARLDEQATDLMQQIEKG